MPNSPSPATDASKQPIVFMISPMQRSGSNFLFNLLVKSRVCASPNNPILETEDWFLPHLYLLKKFIAQVTKSRGGLESAYKVESEILAARLLREFGEAIKRTIGPSPDRPVIVKTPYADNIDNFFDLFGSEKLLILVRDGRDSCESSFRSGFSKTRSDAFEMWNQNATQIQSFLDGVRGSTWEEHVRFARYEDVLKDPQQEVASIALWLGQAAENLAVKDPSELPVYGSSELSRTSENQFHYSVESAPKDFNPVGRWHDWPQSEREAFKRIANGPLVAFGYEDGDEW